MDDGMNDDVAASRTIPSEQPQQQKPDRTDRRLSGGHFQGFRQEPKSHGIFSKEGKIGKHLATKEGGEEKGESKTGGSGKRIHRSEMYGGYGA